MKQEELPVSVINKELLRKRFRCAAQTYDKYAVVQKEMASELVEMASGYMPSRHRKFTELGCGTGILTRKILDKFTSKEYLINDLVPEVFERVDNIFKEKSISNYQFIAGDAELIDLPLEQDVVWSGATLQWIEGINDFFMKISNALAPKGYFVFSSFDVDNYKEIKSITGNGITYKSIEEIIIAASLHFRLVDIKSWERKLWFNSPMDILKHMRYTGVNGVTTTKWGKHDLTSFEENYRQYQIENQYPLSYHPFVMILQKM